MFKILSATALSATIALTSLSPTAAHAGNDEIGRIIFGAGVLAIIAAAVNASQDDNDRDDPRRTYYPPKEVHNHKTVNRIVRQRPPSPPPPPRVDVRRPIQKVETRKPVQLSRVVPSRCGRSYKVSEGRRVYFMESCLKDAGIRTSSLPDQCERILDMPGKREDRHGWNRGCLQSNGYTIR